MEQSTCASLMEANWPTVLPALEKLLQRCSSEELVVQLLKVMVWAPCLAEGPSVRCHLMTLRGSCHHMWSLQPLQPMQLTLVQSVAPGPPAVSCLFQNFACSGMICCT